MQGFGLFTIIVLGEVVLGVVEEMVSSERDGLTIAMGLLAFCISFGTTHPRLEPGTRRSLLAYACLVPAPMVQSTGDGAGSDSSAA